MAEYDIIPIQALQCPNCKQVLKEKDYPEDASIDYCVYCGTKFINGNSPRRIITHEQPVYKYSDYDHAKMMRREIGNLNLHALDVDATQNLIIRNVEALGLGYSYEYLTKREFEKWKLGFKRGFDRPQILGNFYNHILDTLLGAMIAKKQFGMEFDGSDPYGGRFGYSMIMPHHMGRKHWGVDGGKNHIEIVIGKNMVCVITGYMDGNVTGAIRQVRPTTDGKKKAWRYTQPNFASGEILNIDQAFILHHKTHYALEYKPREIRKAQLQPVGVAYTPYKLMVTPKIGAEWDMVDNRRPSLEIIPQKSKIEKIEKKKKEWETLILSRNKSLK